MSLLGQPGVSKNVDEESLSSIMKKWQKKCMWMERVKMLVVMVSRLVES